MAYRNRAMIGKAMSELSSNAAVTGSRVLSKDGHAYGALSDAKVFMKGISDALGDNPSVIRTLRGGFDSNIQEKMHKSSKLLSVTVSRRDKCLRIAQVKTIQNSLVVTIKNSTKETWVV